MASNLPVRVAIQFANQAMVSRVASKFAAKKSEAPKKPKLTPEQKKALAAYRFAEQQEDRYLGSVFVNSVGQKRYEAMTKAAYETCKRLGLGVEHGL
jgi:cell division protein FtsN